jgi:ectoine hydroxylase-related dioxygenase (phytanoyl-CoA dioxygenase family)
MTQGLTREQLAQYAARGYVSPLAAFEPPEAARYRAQLEAMEAAEGGITHDRARKMHLYLRWVDEIVRHPRILDAVQDLIGPDILLYHVTLWLKEPHSDSRISWHQDSTYFGLAPVGEGLHVTAWVALTASDRRSGCVQVVPGSHHGGQVRHVAGQLPGNMFRTGQQIDVPAEAPTDALVLQPGEFSLHHTWLHHASMPNRSDDRRIGLGISYIPTRCKCTARQRLSAMLVRGTDSHRHFDPEPRPVRDMGPQALESHAQAMRHWHAARDQLIAEAHAGGE